MKELKDDVFYSPTTFADLRGCSLPKGVKYTQSYKTIIILEKAR